MISKLSNNLLASPFLIQCAVDRQWERAWKIDPKNISFTDQQISEFAEKAEMAAIEIFYETKEGTDFYFGLQYKNDLKNVTSLSDFLEKSFSLLKKTSDLSLPAVIKNLGKTLQGDENFIKMNEPTLIVMGVVNWWMSYGPCTIWNEGEDKVMNEKMLTKKLVGHEKLVSNENNYVGLEFEYLRNPKYWFSFQVSQKRDNRYILQTAEIKNILNDYLSFNVI